MTDRRVFCRKCGRAAAWAGYSLDPDVPLVLCAWSDATGTHGHGRQLGTYDPGLAAALKAEAQERRRERNHAAGRHDPKRPVRTCKGCQRDAGHSRHRALRISEPGCPKCEAVRVQAGQAHA